MTSWEMLTSPAAACVLVVAYVGSLIACKKWWDRLCFTAVMPIAYGMLCFLIAMILGFIANWIFGSYADIKVQHAVFLAASLICFGIFILQVKAMSTDTRDSPLGYSLRRKGKRYPAMRTPTLQRLPTRKRWSG